MTSPRRRSRASGTSSRRRACPTTRRTSRPRRRKPGSAADLHRPTSLVGIVDQGSQLFDGDIWGILRLLGAISLVLALFNLLPVLPFDGGHTVVVVYEGIMSKVRGRRVMVDYRKLIPVSAVVVIFLMVISLSAMFLDIQRLGQ